MIFIEVEIMVSFLNDANWEKAVKERQEIKQTEKSFLSMSIN